MFICLVITGNQRQIRSPRELGREALRRPSEGGKKYDSLHLQEDKSYGVYGETVVHSPDYSYPMYLIRYCTTEFCLCVCVSVPLFITVGIVCVSVCAFIQIDFARAI